MSPVYRTKRFQLHRILTKVAYSKKAEDNAKGEQSQDALYNPSLELWLLGAHLAGLLLSTA